MFEIVFSTRIRRIKIYINTTASGQTTWDKLQQEQESTTAACYPRGNITRCGDYTNLML